MKVICLFIAWLCVCSSGSAEPILRHRIAFDGRMIEVVERDGLAIYQGDIVLGKIDEILVHQELASDKSTKGSTVGGVTRLWPLGASGNHEVPYVIELDPENRIPSAITTFNNELAGVIQFVPRTTQTDYVAFSLSGSGTLISCFAVLGRNGGRQTIGGSRSCPLGFLLHEMGHAVGLWHEQQRVDYQQWLTVFHDRVEPAYVSQLALPSDQRDVGAYDFRSIMHYPPFNVSKEALPWVDSIPPGIEFGRQSSFSQGDIDTIRRLYGRGRSTIVIDSNPPGLAVSVDGVMITTPHTFDWPLGSAHTLDVSTEPQTLDNTKYIFGRWSSDLRGNLARRQNIVVRPGSGTLTQPSTLPAVSTYLANFIPVVEVRIGASGNGSVVADPSPFPLPGQPGVYYQNRQAFSLNATPGLGASFGRWAGSYGYRSSVTGPYANPFRGPLFVASGSSLYSFQAQFTDSPLVSINAVGPDGEVIGLNARLVSADGQSATQSLPYTTLGWRPGEVRTITLDSPASPTSTSIRYVFRDWNGDSSPTVSVAAPSLGQSSSQLQANVTKQYFAFVQVNPGCGGGSVASTPSIASWQDHGATLTVRATPSPGWVFAGWEGSLSGGASTANYTVTDIPHVIANFNTIATPLKVTNRYPTVAFGDRSLALQILGTGFTPETRVSVAGTFQPVQFINSNTLSVIISANQLPAIGKVMVSVRNQADSGSCAVIEAFSVDILPQTATLTPQTGWWWNADESGRGFFVEKQDDRMFVAGFYYEDDGRATWFTAAGPMSGNRFNAPMYTARDGQTLTGPYRQYQVMGPIGNISLEFTSDSTATLQWPGGTIQLTRYAYGLGGRGIGDNGWWWNAEENGRGFAIERQGDKLFALGFMYDSSGNPVWYITSGEMSDSRTFNGVWLQFGNGQTLTGSYRTPQLANPNVGSVRFEFESIRNATMVLPDGRRLALTRYEF